MKTKLFILALIALPLFVLGQTNDPSTNAVHDVDTKITAAVAQFSYWQGMLLPITLVLVAAIKKWVTFIPDKALPWVAPVIGGLLDMAAEKFGLWTGNPAIGAAMGGLATWAHQALVVQPQQPNENKAGAVVSLLLIASLSFGALTTTGCSIFGKAERTAAARKFDTYKIVYDGAESAYKQFKRECFAGKITAKREAAADRAWNDFRFSYEAAFRIGMEDVPAPENVIALKNALIRIISTL